jgi:hypothetical protein
VSDQSGQGAQGYTGQYGIPDAGNDDNVMEFAVRQLLGDVRTIVPVRVVAVNGGGTGAAPPTVDVHPLIAQIDGVGNATAHGVVLGLPVLRWQSANGSVIVDPVVGDVGLIMCSDRDMSALSSSNGADVNPGSFRRHNLADGVYLGGLFGSGPPPQFVAMTATGIALSDRNGNVLEMKSGEVDLTTTLFKVNGAVHATGAIIAGFGGGDQVGLQTHVHTGNNIPPTAGS